MSQRDAFLLQEISDLEKSMVNLENLISDLKESLKLEFETGLLHINQIFDSYVKRLFGGGGAKVFVVDIESRKKKEDGEEGDANDEAEEIKTGIDVEVEIPKKKVKGLHSLSGGERALISIALNFSIINQNPAPFMILDETDAALDEANSKRYGEILEMLKKETKLIVVTHNRETMHFADQVYGITLAKEGHSKVLSVSFEDAIEYAK
jgi:chromosome segregation protein